MHTNTSSDTHPREVAAAKVAVGSVLRRVLAVDQPLRRAANQGPHQLPPRQLSSLPASEHTKGFIDEWSRWFLILALNQLLS